MKEGGPILFYDGDCGVCTRSVQWILRHDHRGVLRFASLQGTTYTSITQPKPTDVSTAVLLVEGKLHTQSSAILRAMLHMGGVWSIVARILLIIPPALRDPAYRWVARNRHVLSAGGVPGSCRLPTPAERARMLP